MHDLIFVSLENWDDIWRRNQFLCAGLARRHPDSRILFVGPARDLSHDLKHGKTDALHAPAVWTVPGCSNITVTRPLKIAPNTLAAGRKINESLFRAHVRKAASALDMQSPLLWLNPHSAVHMAGRMGESGVIYDITDDWISLTQSPALKRLTTIQDRMLCKRADAVIVCSERLYEMKQVLAGNLHLIPNGVDAEHYSKVLDGDGPLPAAASGWRKPVLGYTGTVHPDRVDIELVEAVARRLPEWTLAFVGPSFLKAEDRERLERCGNVELTGPVPYAEIPNTMRAFDVCMTPHRVTPFTESLNPIKLWEYLAAGKPIASTNVAGFRDYPNMVRIAADADEFAREARAALEEDRGLGSARRAEARRHSWDSRIDAVENVMRAVQAGKVTLESRSLQDDVKGRSLSWK